MVHIPQKKQKKRFKISIRHPILWLWGGAFVLLLLGLTAFWSFRPSWDALPSFDTDIPVLPPERAFQVHFQAKPGVVDLLLKIAPGHTLYAQRITAKVEKGSAVLGAWKLPPAQMHWDAASQKEVLVYRLEQVVHFPVVFPVDAPHAEASKSILAVTLQGCADAGVCYTPITYRTRMDRLVLQPSQPLALSSGTLSKEPILRSAAAETNFLSKSTFDIWWSGLTDSQAALAALHHLNTQRSASGFLYGWTPVAFFVLFFIFGVVLSALPCSWPMIPIVSALIVQANVHHKSSHLAKPLSPKDPPSTDLPATASWLRSMRLSFAYVLGMASVYALCGAIAALAGQRFGASFGYPWVTASFALVMVIMAIMLLRGHGFTLPLIRRIMSKGILKTQGRASIAFVIGAVSALTLSPCMSAPLFGVLAFIAQTGHIGIGALALFALGLGLGVPLIILGAGLGAYLPGSGVWMRYVQRFIGLALLVMGGYLAMPAGIALWDTFGEQQNVVKKSIEQGAQAGPPFQSVHTLAELNTAIQAQSKITLLKIFAENCSACRKIERTTLASPLVGVHLPAFNLIQLNVSENHPAIDALLKHFGLYGPPAFLFFDAQGKEFTALRRVGYISDQALAQLLKEAQAINAQN